MSVLRDLCPDVLDAIKMNAEAIGNYWFECDVTEHRADPAEHVPTLVDLQAKLIAKEYNYDEEVVNRFLTKASKRNYLQRISDYIEGKGNGVE